MHPIPAATRVYGRWRDHYSFAMPGRQFMTLVHVYDAPIPCDRQLRVGEVIQIIALSPATYRTLCPSTPRHTYDVYDPQIVGRVVATCPIDGGGERVAIENDRPVSVVGLVVVDFPVRSPRTGAPVDLDYPRCWLRDLLGDDGHRCVLEDDAVVLDDLGPDVTPVRALCFPDPGERAPIERSVQERPGWRPWLV